MNERPRALSSLWLEFSRLDDRAAFLPQACVATFSLVRPEVIARDCQGAEYAGIGAVLGLQVSGAFKDGQEHPGASFVAFPINGLPVIGSPTSYLR